MVGGVDLNKSWFESGNVAVSEAVGELIGICVGNLQETGGSLPSRSQNQTVDREAYTKWDSYRRTWRDWKEI